MQKLDLDLFLPTMDAPDKVYQLFRFLGFKVLDSHLKTNPSVYSLPVKEAALVEKIFAVSNYDRRFQILLFKLKEENKEAIRTIPEKILREVDFPFIIFTPDFKTYTFTLVEKVREGPGEFKRKLTKLVVDSSQPYHTDKEILSSLALSTDIKNSVEVYKLFQSAFSVERVTRKFFTEYREVFEKLSKEIAKQNKHLRFTLFSREGSVENFTKILLGRLMFLYFIQKRGWLNCFDGWGSGDKKFLYNKFQEAKKNKKNYFKDYLEPLFFDTLNNPRRDKPDQATQFGGRIPFLNGGLFDPEYDYQDVRNHILLENSTFDEVFSVFEKYNFTVKEDEPLEKEVAIDPEMLGKVFENLLEENLRKGKGTYYTPREIVHYMCHESLINYLASETAIDTDQIRNFLDREQSLEKKETLSPAIRQKAKEIDENLVNIKVLDPACGSGAFLVGMLHEVINARLSLNRELGRSLSEYELKKATIQNNIYGVDIDPGAAEIAKLRLWLTLVVDHNLSEIEPLPNLDYKIMVGNSLLDEFMGVKLFNLEKARGITSHKKMLNLFEEDSQLDLLEDQSRKSTVLTELQKLHQIYFKEPDPEKKKQIRTQIDEIEFNLIEATVKDEVSKLESQTKQIADKFLYAGVGIPASEAERISKLSSQQAQILETFNEIKKSNVKPFFLFQLHFSDVFERKGGFDIVIANPPYVEFKKLKKLEKDKLTKYYQSAKGKFDLYVVFLELGAKLLNANGYLTFIMPTMFMKRDYGEAVRNYISENLKVLKIFDFADIQVFESVTNYTGIFFLTKYGLDKPQFVYKRYKDIGRQILPEEFVKSLDETETNRLFDYIIASNNSITNLPWNFNPKQIDQLFSKLHRNSILLEKLVDDFFEGIASGKDEVFYIDRKVIDDYQIEKSIIHKLLKGVDVKRYRLNWSGTYVIYPYDDNSKAYKEDYLSNKFPNAYNYLKSKRSILSGRPYFQNSNKHWFELWNQRDINKFKQTRIVTPEISRNNNFAFCEGFFGNTKTYNLILKDKDRKNYFYYLGLLNSKLIEFFYKNASVPKAGGYIEYKKQFLNKIPIKNEVQTKNKIVQLVDKILFITKLDDYVDNKEKQAQVKAYEKEIDQLVYKLYGLTPEEIAIVEGNHG